MTNIENAREWARVARQKFEHYEQNVAPNWLANPTAVSHHEQSLAKTVPFLVEQIEALLNVFDAAARVVDLMPLEHGDVDDLEAVQGEAATRLAEAVQALRTENSEAAR